MTLAAETLAAVTVKSMALKSQEHSVTQSSVTLPVSPFRLRKGSPPLRMLQHALRMLLRNGAYDPGRIPSTGTRNVCCESYTERRGPSGR